jgi:hypothetical protein
MNLFQRLFGRQKSLFGDLADIAAQNSHYHITTQGARDMSSVGIPSVLPPSMQRPHQGGAL